MVIEFGMESGRLRVLSYNIHKGFSSGNRKFVLHQMREAIRAAQPDLVFLQEVQGEHAEHRRSLAEWPSESQFEFLAHEIWPHFTYGRNAVYNTGHHGNAILSKFPVTFAENIDISTNRLERRGLLHALIQLPDRAQPIHAICVHLGLIGKERMAQIGMLCDRIESHVPHHEPLMICGDFNDWRNQLSRKLEERLEVREAYKTLHGSHARTFPSWLPALRLDRIYYRGLAPKQARCLSGKPWNDLSDHYALYAEMTLASVPGESPEDPRSD